MQCTKGCGKVVVTQVVSVDSCASFGNDNGALVCDDRDESSSAIGDGTEEEEEGSLENAEDIPVGSYRESCRGCRILEAAQEDENENNVSSNGSDKTLSCTACKSWNGAVYASMIANFEDCTDIDNQNGQLVCSEGKIPQGSYQESCNQCEIAPGTPNMLSCRCRNSSGKRVRTVLEPPEGGKNFAMCRNIDNDNGQLVCERNENMHGAEASAGSSRDEL